MKNPKGKPYAVYIERPELCDQDILLSFHARIDLARKAARKLWVFNNRLYSFFVFDAEKRERVPGCCCAGLPEGGKSENVLHTK